MGKVTGFIEIQRKKHPTRPVEERVRDWREVYLSSSVPDLQGQGARCMDCGIPFCHQGCPLGNLIPDWNDLVYRDRWRTAIDRLHATNNFPEFTGRLCPAPCEGACVLGINDDPVTIKDIEVAIIDRAFQEGWVEPQPPETRTFKKVAVVGSGPAGLAAADQLNRAGHSVTVFEKSDRIGGLLRYGIPEFKMEKRVLDRRLSLMEAEGVIFRAGIDIGRDVPVEKLRRDYDAVLLAAGAGQPRDLPVPGRELTGIHFAMEYLTLQNRRNEGDFIPELEFISAEGKHVIFRAGIDIGRDVPVEKLRRDYDAVLLAAGAGQPRDLPVPGRELTGIHFAMEFLTLQNRRNEGDFIPESEFISAEGKHVIIIGGGDTGADCLGTTHRQRAKSVTQLELMPMPPQERAEDNPWPLWPQIFRVSTAHEEGGERLFSVSTQRFSGDVGGHVRALHAVKVEMVRKDARVAFQPIPGSEFEIPADLVLLAMGFVGPERGPLVDEFGLKLTDRGNVWRDERWMTSVPAVFTAGDMQRGQSLIVWAIAEGRSAARAIDYYLMGESALPAPLA